ncbi:MAG: superoxide dismutase [Ni] [Candidatus Marinimicrobia bacterium]|nr:superoxide dismutase [Ni] [Candidatus Neomarinimicrobiota bacterium]
MKKVIKWCLSAILMISMITPAFAHCEIPCGIYGDSLRVELIREHVMTIEKSMKMINELSKAKNPNYNQLVRWVNNKDEHAEKIQDLAAQYFMFQRIKSKKASDVEAYAKYLLQLEHMHQITVEAMKCKQGTDKEHAKKILEHLMVFEESYFHKHDH